MRRLNSSGKTLTLFLVVIAVLLVCLTGISVFFFLREVDLRQAAEYNVEQGKIIETRLNEEIRDLKKQAFVLEEKNKEAEDQAESLMEELELERGLREETKKENRDLSDQLATALRARTDLQEKMRGDLAAAEQKIADLQKSLEEAQARLAEAEASAQRMSQKVELEPIVVNPAGRKGRVVSVDRDTNFLIVSLGEVDGLTEGALLGVYRDGEYLGDVKVSRVLPKMAAADFLPPLTSSSVETDDRVEVKDQ